MVRTDLYLTFQETKVSGGKNFHYLKAAFLPDDILTGILVYFLECELGVDLFPYFEAMPNKFPASIPLGTNVYSLDGSPWSAPANLYLISVQDRPAGGTLIPAINDITSRIPVAIYAEEPPSQALAIDLPIEINPATYPPNQPSNPLIHMPESWGLFTSEAFFNNGGSTGWLHWFGLAYGDCEITNPSHVFLNTDTFSFAGIDPGGEPYYESPGRWPYECCNDEVQIGNYWVEIRLNELLVIYYVPIGGNGGLWWHPEILGIGQGTPDYVGILASVFSTFLTLVGLPGSSIPLLRNFSLGTSRLNGVAGAVYPLASDDKAIVVTV